MNSDYFVGSFMLLVLSLVFASAPYGVFLMEMIWFGAFVVAIYALMVKPSVGRFDLVSSKPVVYSSTGYMEPSQAIVAEIGALRKAEENK